MEQQPHPQRHIYRATATSQDYEMSDIGDWVEDVGDITTYFERAFVRRFGDALCASHGSQQEQSEVSIALLKVWDIVDKFHKSDMDSNETSFLNGILYVKNRLEEMPHIHLKEHDAEIRADERKKHGCTDMATIKSRQVCFGHWKGVDSDCGNCQIWGYCADVTTRSEAARKEERERVLKEVWEKCYNEMGFQSSSAYHDPEDTYIPSLECGEISDILKSLLKEDAL